MCGWGWGVWVCVGVCGGGECVMEVSMCMWCVGRVLDRWTFDKPRYINLS
jgi:hypothetical protein